MLYVVSGDEYSGDGVLGIFDDKSKAETAWKYYACKNAIKECSLNPPLPVVDGFAYAVRCDVNEKSTIVDRVSNSEPLQDWVLESTFGDKEQNGIMWCCLLADNEQHAQGIASEKLAAFLAGSTFAKHKSFSWEGSGEPHHHTYRMIEGKLTETSEEPNA